MLKRSIAIADSAWASFNYVVLLGVKQIYDSLELLPDWMVNVDASLKDLNANIEYWSKRTNADLSAAFNPETPELWTGKVVEMMEKTSNTIDQMSSHQEKLKTNLGLTAAEVLKLGDNYKVVDGKIIEITESQKKAAYVMPEWAEGMKELWITTVKTKSEVDALAKVTEESLQNFADIGEVSSFEKLRRDLSESGIHMEVLADGSKSFTEEMIKAGDATEETKEELSKLEEHELRLQKDKYEHDLKMIEINTKEAHELIQKQVEWTAKVKIAEAEASAKKLQALAEMTSSSFEKVTETIGKMTEILGGQDYGSGAYKDIYSLIESQVSVQNKLTDAQTELVKANVDNIRIKNDLMKNQGLVIKVNVEGDTQGWLEGMLNELLNAIFIKAKGESFSCFGV